MKNIIKKLKVPNILMFGAPGAGKGTYGTLLSEDLRFKNISTGDEIRAFLKNGNLSEEMRQIQDICKSGGLVNDTMIMKIIRQKLSESKNFNGFIFDGFPRTLSQAELFASEVDTSFSYVINLVVNEGVVIEKLGGRRICQDCGTGYNFCNIDRDGYKMTPLMPKNPEHNCDNCGGRLIRRDDDDPEVIRERLGVYRRETEPVLDFFHSEGITVLNFEAKKGKKDYPNLLKIVQKEYIDTVMNGRICEEKISVVGSN